MLYTGLGRVLLYNWKTLKVSNASSSMAWNKNRNVQAGFKSFCHSEADISIFVQGMGD